jgi:hypothetical protein
MARSERRPLAPVRPRSLRRGRLALAASIAMLVPLSLACNSLIGLSDFEKTQCAGARCADDGGPLPDQLVEGGADGQADALPDAKGADPVSWAKWPMPNYGEGGAGLPLTSPPLVAGTGIVTDTVTTLVWRSTLVPGDFSATEAEAECEKLANGPWRAPKRIELVTLLDYSHATPFIDRNAFKDLLNYQVWSTSPVRVVDVVPGAKPDQPYWVVNFGSGAVEPLAGDLKAKVLCVRAK